MPPFTCIYTVQCTGIDIITRTCSSYDLRAYIYISPWTLFLLMLQNAQRYDCGCILLVEWPHSQCSVWLVAAIAFKTLSKMVSFHLDQVVVISQMRIIRSC